ncbi:hypothetical protein [Nonomuraea endophytica]|uniref:hypothetical protein n=1 Tax=Nonomuraea endophytica TaxID=714136 RepID=UPI0037CC4ABD
MSFPATLLTSPPREVLRRVRLLVRPDSSTVREILKEEGLETGTRVGVHHMGRLPVLASRRPARMR